MHSTTDYDSFLVWIFLVYLHTKIYRKNYVVSSQCCHHLYKIYIHDNFCLVCLFLHIEFFVDVVI